MCEKDRFVCFNKLIIFQSYLQLLLLGFPPIQTSPIRLETAKEGRNKNASKWNVRQKSGPFTSITLVWTHRFLHIAPTMQAGNGQPHMFIAKPESPAFGLERLASLCITVCKEVSPVTRKRGDLFLNNSSFFARAWDQGDVVGVLTVVAGHHSGIKAWGGRRGIVLSVRANVKPDWGRTEATYCVP
jgi:hypothetical protein